MLIEAAEATGRAESRPGPGGRLLAQAWLETCFKAWQKHGQMVRSSVLNVATLLHAQWEGSSTMMRDFGCVRKKDTRGHHYRSEHAFVT